MPAPMTATRFATTPPPSAGRRRRPAARHAAPGLHDRGGAVALAQVLDGGQGAREAVRLVQVPLAERAARAVHARRIQGLQAERVEVLQLLVREGVVDLGQVDGRRRESPRGRRRSRPPARGRRAIPVAALERRRVLVPADAVHPHRVVARHLLGRQHHHDASVHAARGLVGRQRLEGGGGVDEIGVRGARVSRACCRLRTATAAQSSSVHPLTWRYRRISRPATAAAGMPSGRFSTGSSAHALHPAVRHDLRGLRVRLDRDASGEAAADQHDGRSRARTGRRSTTVWTGRCTAPS